MWSRNNLKEPIRAEHRVPAMELLPPSTLLPAASTKAEPMYLYILWLQWDKPQNLVSFRCSTEWEII